MAKGNISRKMKKINGESLSGGGDMLLEKGWKKIAKKTLEAADVAQNIVFAPTTGSTDNTTYITTNAFECEKIKIYYKTPQDTSASTGVGGYVRIASDATGIAFVDNKFGAFTIKSSSYRLYGIIEIYANGADAATYAEFTATGRLGASATTNKQVSFGETELTADKVTGIHIICNSGNLPVGTKFVIWGVDK